MCDGGLGEGLYLREIQKRGQAEVTVIRLDRISAPYVIYVIATRSRVQWMYIYKSSKSILFYTRWCEGTPDNDAAGNKRNKQTDKRWEKFVSKR